jgi:hypothetical protein
MIKKLLLVGMLLISLVGLPLTIYLFQNKQDPRAGASAGTTLSLIPQPGPSSAIEKNVGNTIPTDLVVNPGSNQVSILRVQVKYDPTKLEINPTEPFTPTQRFTFLQSPPPDTRNGLISFTITVGTDPTKAIQTVTKAGTFNFIAIGATNDIPTIISLTDETKAYSLGANDQASENILSTTNRAEVTIDGIETSPEPSATLTPTNSPTPTQTPPTPTLTPTLSPAVTISSNQFRVTSFLHSIGNSGDNANPTAHSLSNKNPKTQPRSFTITVYNSDTTQIVATQTANLLYNIPAGNFTGIIPLGSNLVEGDYIIKVKTDSFLQRKIPGFFHITPATQIDLPTITLVAGDANNDNKTNILDYNLLVGCYTDFLPPTDCNDVKKVQTDFNDDEIVNQVDINLFLREISVQNGD